MTHPGITEHGEQAALFAWAEAQRNVYPELEMMYAVPNWRVEKKHRIYLAQEGVKAGVPDVWLPVPRNPYAGLVIELKVKDNTPTKEQLWWLENLSRHGYFTAVCWGMDNARELIEDYLENRLIHDFKDVPYLEVKL